MIFVYFILICIVLGLISWFVVPMIEKNESLTNTIKNIIKGIESIILAIFILYSFVAVLTVTTDLINKWLNINNGGTVALIILIILGYRLIKKYNEK